jgi:oxygen-independent coproporphyrinogen-3 oxidase
MPPAPTTARPEPATTRLDQALTDTDVGSVFVSNYPPYSFWSQEHVGAAQGALGTAGTDGETGDLGLYLHIPFCRKRCKFCYFRVYVDRNATQVQQYLDALVREIELYAQQPRIEGRQLKFVYFGGGTPSYISARHLRSLVSRAKAALPWDAADEVAFECEPGTLTEAKVAAIADIGVTRLSLGVENLNDHILQENGRAHTSKEVFRSWPWIRAAGFRQVNVDLIAGMVAETWDDWRDTVTRTIDLDADSITIYQMELPYNTVYSKAIGDGQRRELILADWRTKRQWHAHAIEALTAAGYEQTSAYSLVRSGRPSSFVYRDALWRGSDMIGTGVASISHMAGVHYQNEASWDDYLGALGDGRLPIGRALPTTAAQRLTREMILQLKLGRIRPPYFRDKYGVDVLAEFEPAWRTLQSEGMLSVADDEVALTATGLLRVDQLLPLFYAAEFQNARYT